MSIFYWLMLTRMVLKYNRQTENFAGYDSHRKQYLFAMMIYNMKYPYSVPNMDCPFINGVYFIKLVFFWEEITIT